jgi:hypothetical protein
VSEVCPVLFARQKYGQISTSFRLDQKGPKNQGQTEICTCPVLRGEPPQKSRKKNIFLWDFLDCSFSANFKMAD